MISIEKAILADVCLGVPVGKIVFGPASKINGEELAYVPDTLLFRGEQLGLIKKLYDDGDPAIVPAVEALIAEAEKAADAPLVSVIDKPKSRFSDDPHDYQSLAKYWWPAADGTDGGYERRDGEINPDCYDEDFDALRLAAMSERVVALALAAFLTGGAAFGRRGAAQISAWFVDPATRQNPNFRFAQTVPGREKGTAPIEARHLIYVTEAFRLLESIGAISPHAREQVREWFRELLTWLAVSPEGQRARQIENNIGLWYDLQCMVYAALTGERAIAEAAEERLTERLDRQIEPDGSLPAELLRNRPQDYVAFSVAAMAMIARAGEGQGLDLWSQRDGDGRSFQAAHDWLVKAAQAQAIRPPVDLSGDLSVDKLLDLGLQLRAMHRIAERRRGAFEGVQAELAAERLNQGALTEERDQALAAAARAGELERRLADNQALIETLRREVAAKSVLDKQRIAEIGGLRRQLDDSRQGLEGLRIENAEKSALETRRVAEIGGLRRELGESQQVAQWTRADAGDLESRARRIAEMAASLKADRAALAAYSVEIEKRYRMVVDSTTWRAMAPVRFAMRWVRSYGRSGKPGLDYIPRPPVLSKVLAERGLHIDASPKAKRGASQPIKKKLIKAAGRHLPKPAKKAVKNLLAAVIARKSIRETMAGAAARLSPGGNADALAILHAAAIRDEEGLKREYHQKGLEAEPDTFVLYRIIGNDLFPRHKKGQSRENVRFLLDHEPELADCEKRWVVNRIIDPEEERQILSMLDERQQSYIRIPFVAEEYRSIGWDFDALPEPGYLSSRKFFEAEEQEPGLFHNRAITALYRLKNLYVMNNNGARNAALEDGRSRAKWVLPFDGNSFITASAWSEIRKAVTSRPHLKYFVVPMERITDNAALLRDDFRPHPIEEPQLLFRRDAAESFNPHFPYGRRPKVELFWRLGIPGPWSRWRDDPWEQKRRELSPEANQFAVAGWVARMFSGAGALEQSDIASFKNRGRVRQEAIIAAIDHIDQLVGIAKPDGDDPVFYPLSALDAAKAVLDADEGSLLPLAQRIVADAEKALKEGPYSVVQKTTLPPSGDRHDYWHPAPYWWPDPKKKDGLPFIKKDGQRVPGTHMYEEASGQYDRTRLQLMFDATTALALGWYLTGRQDFADHAAGLVRTWFLDPATKMNPHLRFSQVRRGHNGDEGYESGIIELKDLYYVLDAVRLLERSGAFSATDSAGLKEWLGAYSAWLETSKQGQKEVIAANNHGTYYDLQTAAIAAYLGDREKFRNILFRAQGRICQQIAPDGVQPEEMERSITEHYVFFNLQGWLCLFRLAQAHGSSGVEWRRAPNDRIAEAYRWILKHDVAAWPFQQIEPFDSDRLYPLAAAAQSVGIASAAGLARTLGREPRFAERKPVFNPHDAVMPYWAVGLPLRKAAPLPTPELPQPAREGEKPARRLPDKTIVPRELTHVDEVIDALPAAPADGEDVIAFLISMRSIAASRDWDGACSRLASTLRTLLAQTDKNFRILVAGHERPDIPELNEPGVEWFSVDIPRPADVSQYTRDKTAKRRHLGVMLRKSGFSGLVMALDADDWVHRRFVEYFRRKGGKAHQILDAGFVVNWSRNEVWLRATSTGRPFYKGCGSSALYRLTNADLPTNTAKDTVRALKFNYTTGSHNTMPDQLKESGQLLDFVDIPLATWVLGHGNNNTLVKGKKKPDITHLDAIYVDAQFASAFRFDEDRLLK